MPLVGIELKMIVMFKLNLIRGTDSVNKLKYV